MPRKDLPGIRIINHQANNAPVIAMATRNVIVMTNGITRNRVGVNKNEPHRRNDEALSYVCSFYRLLAYACAFLIR